MVPAGSLGADWASRNTIFGAVAAGAQGLLIDRDRLMFGRVDEFGWGLKLVSAMTTHQEQVLKQVFDLGDVRAMAARAVEFFLNLHWFSTPPIDDAKRERFSSGEFELDEGQGSCPPICRLD